MLVNTKDNTIKIKLGKVEFGKQSLSWTSNPNTDPKMVDFKNIPKANKLHANAKCSRESVKRSATVPCTSTSTSTMHSE